MNRSRLATIALSVVALAATSFGIAIAATDGSASASPYDIQGKLPKTMAMHFAIGSDGVNITGRMDVDMVHNTMDGEIDIPVAVLMARLHIREVANTLYVGAGAFSAGAKQQWMAQPLGSKLDLTGLALTMAKPKVGLLPPSFGAPTVTQDGDITKHVYTVDGGSFGLPLSSPATVELDTASKGQVVGLTITASEKGQSFTITLKVDSYNTVMKITKPAASSVKPLDAGSLQQIVASNSTLKTLMGILGNNATSSSSVLQSQSNDYQSFQLSPEPA